MLVFYNPYFTKLEQRFFGVVYIYLTNYTENIVYNYAVFNVFNVGVFTNNIRVALNEHKNPVG
jgi:hypothetical protein